MARLSNHVKNKRTKKRGDSFLPDIDEWKKACTYYPSNVQISKHFDISRETFYAFLDKEHYKQEQDSNYKSAYIDLYKNARNGTRLGIYSNLLDMVKRQDNAAIIYSTKIFGGAIEERDKKLIAIKKYEAQFKAKQFLTSLAEKFNLDYNQLNKFANRYFKELDLDKE